MKHFAACLCTFDAFCGFLEQNGSKIQQHSQHALIMLQNATTCTKMQPKVLKDVPKRSKMLQNATQSAQRGATMLQNASKDAQNAIVLVHFVAFWSTFDANWWVFDVF
ncbi:MAG: hypothetical protein GY795_15340 [Desulfobacterales bacterium]|nr:hypothetical protein [Desulfobacterales bacterium]